MSTKTQLLKEIVREIKNQTPHVTKFKKLLNELIKNNIDINSKIYHGRTILHYCVKYGLRSYVRCAIRMGVNPELCDDDYNTPIHLAVILNNFQTLTELIKCGCNVNVTGEFEQTPLHLAVVYERYDIIGLLVQSGADINMVDEKNLKPIDYALDEKNDKIISILTKEEHK